MKTIYRYKTSKPMDGHFSFQLHEEAQVLGYMEYWHTTKGWELVFDVLCDSTRPMERRHFFLCAGGDSLDFLGDFPEAYHVGTHYSKGYASYVFDTSHLPLDVRVTGRADWGKLNRGRPDRDELGRSQKHYADERAQQRRELRAM